MRKMYKRVGFIDNSGKQHLVGWVKVEIFPLEHHAGFVVETKYLDRDRSFSLLPAKEEAWSLKFYPHPTDSLPVFVLYEHLKEKITEALSVVPDEYKPECFNIFLEG